MWGSLHPPISTLKAIKQERPLNSSRLSRRLDKAQRGNLGDVKPVGDGVCEMREYFGPGWRMYYVKRGDTLIVMLGGGDKGSQEADIAKAKQLETKLED